MRCDHCHHTIEQHNADKACRVTVTKWDDAAMTWTPKQRCACPGYEGKPLMSTDCPHDFMEGSRVCIWCKRVVSKAVT